MASLTARAQQIIMRNNLGSPMEVYGPHTIASIIGGLFVMAFAAVWIWFALSITGSTLLPPGSSVFNVLSPGAAIGTLPTSDSFSGADAFFSLFRLIFPLFGVLFLLLGLGSIFRAIYNQGMRVVVCTNGVVVIQPSGSGSFYWQDVLTVFHKVQVSSSRNQSTGATSTSIRHAYTVHCRDGRKFVLKSPLARLQDLAETIEVQAARFKRY